MKRLLILGAIQFGFAFTIFVALQDASIYRATLGRVSDNYSRVDQEGRSKIIESSVPFVQITDDNFDRWDAAIYQCIRDKMYSVEEGCYHTVRGAFFPLFPIVWKITGLNRVGISIVNYCLFFISLGFLVWLIPGVNRRSDSLTFAILLTFPSSIIFYLPYTEGLFLLTMSMLVAGILKDHYKLYFVGATLMAMVRPATLFVLLALLAVQGIKFLRDRHAQKFFYSTTKYVMPFVTGYFFSLAIQRYYSGSWTTFFDAQKLWQGGRLNTISKITDWSVEGFGLSSFAIFFICLPATAYLIHYIYRQLNKGQHSPLGRDEEIWLLSLFYLVGIFVYILLTSGGNIHSFWRFTLGSPPFFMAALVFFSRSHSNKVSKLFLYLLVAGAALFLFLLLVPYGGKRLDFSFAGMYLSALSWTFLTLKRSLPVSVRWMLAIPLILSNIVWNAFMFNAFLSQAWIFT